MDTHMLSRRPPSTSNLTEPQTFPSPVYLQNRHQIQEKGFKFHPRPCQQHHLHPFSPSYPSSKQKFSFRRRELEEDKISPLQSRHSRQEHACYSNHYRHFQL
ncbi:hypothetical protein L2E82_46928 [Cichorium intybus]|uniref:Uncharacterized protein n=1 Tax=Cichorium intybus TaxID=13427 RepID=A0ACB8YTY3_CICIN|nr:hypothetical protein L2E82_46928 [Cichorium intybus]